MAERVPEADHQATFPPRGEMSKSDFASEEFVRNASDEYREHVAEIVEESDLPLTLGGLTERVLQREPGVTPTPESRSALHERLYLKDLPALERETALTFDIQRGLVTTGDRSAALAAVDAAADRSPRRDDPTTRRDERGTRRYLFAAAGAVGLFGLTAFEVGVFAALSPTLVSASVVGLFAALALDERR